MMAEQESTVFVVDDDDAVRNSMRWLVESIGLPVETYASAREFLETHDPNRPGCLVLDVRMPGMSGLDLQEKLHENGIVIPIIVVTGHGDVPTAVRAIKAGAVEFIEKPVNDQLLLDTIQRCIEKDIEYRQESATRRIIETRYMSLTPREREVMAQVVAGEPNKVIARNLDLSAKTIEAHRAAVMRKMEADSLANLVHMAITCEDQQEQG